MIQLATSTTTMLQDFQISTSLLIKNNLFKKKTDNLISRCMHKREVLQT